MAASKSAIADLDPIWQDTDWYVGSKLITPHMDMDSSLLHVDRFLYPTTSSISHFPMPFPSRRMGLGVYFYMSYFE